MSYWKKIYEILCIFFAIILSKHLFIVSKYLFNKELDQINDSYIKFVHF